MTISPHARLRQRIDDRSARVAVVGLGHVGLPLARTFAAAGYGVVGLDVDETKVAAIDQLPTSTDPAVLFDVDVVVIAVPTPITPQREPDMSHVRASCEQLVQHLQAGQLVVLSSTSYPGTTDELVLPLLQRSGLRCGRDFFLAYAPERYDPGNDRWPIEQIPRVVGGVDEASTELACALYAKVVRRVVQMSSPRAAEATKLTENVFRAVNIALANELKIICDRLEVDVWEVLDAAETKPFGFMRFDPGPGLGGHCIALDPFLLAWRAQQAGADARFIRLAGEVNLAMPRFVVDRVSRALQERGGRLDGSRILVIGAAYKRDVGDPRQSPALALFDLLSARGATVDYHDPHLPQLPPRTSVQLSAASVAGYDAVIIATDHAAVDYVQVADHARLIIDTRGVFRQRAPHIVKA